MRDLALTILILGALPFALRRPVYGIFLWMWVGIMNPHRLAFGFAYNFPFAQLIAVTTLAGMLLVKKEEGQGMPMTPPVLLLFALVLWMNFTTALALNVDASMVQWEKVMKIMFMLFVGLYLMHSRKHVDIIIW